MADDEVNIDALLGAGVKKVKTAEKIHSDSYLQAKAKDTPKEGSSDADVRKYIGRVIAQYRADARAGGVGKGKVSDTDIEVAFSEVRTMAERFNITGDELVNKVKNGDYTVLDQIQRSHASNELDNIRDGHYHMQVEPHGPKIVDPLADKLGVTADKVAKDMKGHYAKAHELAKDKGYL